jgi:hypothetical protein
MELGKAVERMWSASRSWLRFLAIAQQAIRLLLLGTPLLELINHLVEIGIACAKAPGEPVPTTFGDSLSVSQHLKLTGLARRDHGISTKPLFYQGHETRDLGFIVLSRRAGTYLNFHVSSSGSSGYSIPRYGEG